MAVVDLQLRAQPDVELRRWTRADFERLADSGVLQPNERVELIGGQIVVMAPQDADHTTGITLAHDAARSVFGQGYVVRVQSPLVVGESEPEPDVAVVVGAPRDYAKEHPSTAVLVIEVARTSLAFDRGTKANLYASGGIPDYWVTNLVDRRLELFRDPVALADAPFGHAYRTRTILLPGESAHPLARPEAAIAVADLLPL